VRAAVGEQPRDQVIARLAGTGIDKAAQVLAEFGVYLNSFAIPLFERSGGGVSYRDERVGPLAESRLIF